MPPGGAPIIQAPPMLGRPGVLPRSFEMFKWHWGVAYYRQQPFQPPVTADATVASRMKRASDVFRSLDPSHAGALDRANFNKALFILGYQFPTGIDREYLFRLVDKDYGGTVSEREFVDFWVQHGYELAAASSISS